MDATSQADAGEHLPSTPPAQTVHNHSHDDDFPMDPLTSQAVEKLAAGGEDQDAVNGRVPDAASSDAGDEQQTDIEFRDFDWDDMQNHYEAEMEEQTKVEHKIQEEFARLTEFHRIWQQTPQIQEQERCAKRLRTRVAYVEMQETELAKQQRHHDAVMKAFQSALDMLNPNPGA